MKKRQKNKELLVATRNQKKFNEIKELLRDMPFKVTCLEDYPDMPHIEEDGKTFEQNAIKKAATISLYTQQLVMGEDSGLEIGVLDNQPGIFSARFSGPRATDRKNNAKVLKMLKKVPFYKRTARYRCCVALTDHTGIVNICSGSCSGIIALRPDGKNGFGYDPLFYVKRYQKTFGQLSPSIKAKISHRARALKKTKIFLQKYLASLQK